MNSGLKGKSIGGSVLKHGTSFPSAEYLGDVFVRDDLGFPFIWNGSIYTPVTGDGWIPVPSESVLGYINSASIALSGNYTVVFKKGTRVKFSNPSTKYFVCDKNSTFDGNFTTVFLQAGSDYSVSASSVSGLSYSLGNPPDYPNWFNFTPTFAGFSANPTGFFRFYITGNTLFFHIRCITDGTSNANTFTVDMPIVSATLGSNNFWGGNLWQIRTRGATNPDGLTGFWQIPDNSATITLANNLSATGWTNDSLGKRASFEGWYEI